MCSGEHTILPSINTKQDLSTEQIKVRGLCQVVFLLVCNPVSSFVTLKGLAKPLSREDSLTPLTPRPYCPIKEDLERGGRICYAFMNRLALPLQAWRKYDTDRSGYIEANELKVRWVLGMAPRRASCTQEPPEGLCGHTTDVKRLGK